MTLRAGPRVLPSLPSIPAAHIPITCFLPTISVLAPHLDHTRHFVTFLLDDKSSMHIRALLCCANGNHFADVVSPSSDAKKGVSDAVVR
jgi:hypothetical protein